MNLKKIIPLFLIAMSFTVVMPVLASFEMPVTKTEKPVDQRSQELSNRLMEIRNMDKSNLTKEEKKALKDEKRAIKKEKKERQRNHFWFGYSWCCFSCIIINLDLLRNFV